MWAARGEFERVHGAALPLGWDTFTRGLEIVDIVFFLLHRYQAQRTLRGAG